MLDDLKIRNKLILLVAIPIVVLIVLAGLGVQSRRDTASSAASVQDLVAVARANSAMADALQTEALFSTAYVASGRSEAHREQLETTRAATDAASQAATQHFNANRDTSANFRSSASLAEDAIDKLDYIREAVDQGYQWHQVVETFSDMENTFLAVNDTVSAALKDPEVAAQLRTGAALASFKAAIASQGALLAGAKEQDQGGEAFNQTAMLEAAVDRESSQAAILASIADSGRKGAVRDALTGEERSTFDGARNGLAQDPPVMDQLVANDIPATSSVIQSRLHAVEEDLFAALIVQAQDIRNDAERAATLFLITALAAVAAAIVGAVLLGRRITQPLDHLTEAADHLSSEQMPRLVEWLRNPSEDDMAFELGSLQPIEVDSNDEIGKLATSFNEVQRVAGEVAAEQATLLRKGIGEMFVNLARRNQALLDRQIDFLDDLERTEEDPDQLENLYKLDHLATRMRRNAESLLVLAGAEPPRRRGRPAPLANVVRAAVAEVEDFGRIDLLSFDEILVASNVAADLAHLLSELMENATNFSPPETRVEVVGHRTRADGYVISVSDHGIGMSAEQIDEANKLLAKPPLVGLALSRSLGFIVVGRLSVRHGVTVRLTGSPAGGVTAVVTVPPNLVTDTPGAGEEAPFASTGAFPAAPTAADQGLSPSDQGASPFLAPVPEPQGPVSAPPSAPPLEPAAGGGVVAPLSFSPNEGAAPTGPVRRDTTPATGDGLPPRRSPAPAPAPAASAPTSAPPAVDGGLPPRRSPAAPPAPAEVPPFESMPAPPAAGETAPGPVSFTDPTSTDMGEVRLDGPPPPAPSLPTRARPARPAASATGAAESAGFLEESGPPRLFGRSADSGPATDPAPPAMAPPPVAPPPVAPLPAVAPPTAAPPSQPPAAGAPAATASGLVRRTPRKTSDRVIPGSDASRAAGASRRSPEDVRNLLSGFRAGQARARTAGPADVGSSDPKEIDE